MRTRINIYINTQMKEDLLQSNFKCGWMGKEKKKFQTRWLDIYNPEHVSSSRACVWLQMNLKFKCIREKPTDHKMASAYRHTHTHTKAHTHTLSLKHTHTEALTHAHARTCLCEPCWQPTNDDYCYRPEPVSDRKCHSLLVDWVPISL